MHPPDTAPGTPPANIDLETVEGFGAEWARFNFVGRPETELDRFFDEYFEIFPWGGLPQNAEGFDAGCGSGRWAARVAPRVGRLHCIDASEAAVAVTRKNVERFGNCVTHVARIDDLPLADGSQDFGYSLGVLHHLPDTAAGLAACVKKLKPGAPFLVYIYYSLDNRAPYFRAIWRASDKLRRQVCRLPEPTRQLVSELLALTVYWPLARGARAVEQLGFNPSGLPLASYRSASFYVMRNDALDRFGTRLENRFSRDETRSMMAAAGLERIVFREGPPYWCAVGYKAPG